MAHTIPDALAWWAKTTPESPALAVGGDVIDYRTLGDWMEAIAAGLVAEGLQPGERVAFCGSTSLAYCAAIFGVMRAGGICVPLSPRYTAHELRDILSDIEPARVVADPSVRDKVTGAGAPVWEFSRFEPLRGARPDGARRTLSPDDPVVIISTSGSTARPKGVVYSHRTMLSYVAGQGMEDCGFPKGSRAIVPAPLNTSAGFNMLVQFTVTGCCSFLESVFDAERFLGLIETERVNAFAGAPVFWERIAALPRFRNADVSSIRFAVTGGARVSRQLLEAWLAKGVILRQVYGQTEVGGNATVMPAHLAPEAPEKCGHGGLFTDLAVVDEDGRPCPPGTPGEILMRGPGVMVGYWRNPEATAVALRDGWLWSGDIGVLDEHGLLTFIDRKKDIIISGGLNISAAEVERAVAEFPGVAEVAVIAAHDDRFGETPLAVVHAAAPLDIAALIRHCSERLADFKMPRYVAVEPEPLPRVPAGKIAKPLLREKYRNAHLDLPRVR